MELGIFPTGAGRSCADALGVAPGDVATKHRVGTSEHFFPPSVDCELAGRVVRLTPASRTARWAGVWGGAWVVLGSSPLLLLAGRLRRQPPVSPR